MNNPGNRSRLLSQGQSARGPVVYWMSRDQRVHDNPALLQAEEFAREKGVEYIVLFCLVDRFMEAGDRAFYFMIQGLVEVEQTLASLKVPFCLVRGNPGSSVPLFLEQTGASLLVVDFDPLRIKNAWKREVIQKISIPVVETDAHNIVPCFLASGKLEFGAYTLRPKLKRMIPKFLTSPGEPGGNKKNSIFLGLSNPWEEILEQFFPGQEALVHLPPPGETAAMNRARYFIDHLLQGYAQERNNPCLSRTSRVSAYLHFGQVYAGTIVREVLSCSEPGPDQEAFLEELIVRKELSDNFCHYNPDYDNIAGFPAWARENHRVHREDPREQVYDLARLEGGQTHDRLWNAAQEQMVITGYMHGYMRMYWAKKILEWTSSPEEALKTCIYLNDKYQLDGRDPNGYAGCAWSIGGVHDRAWQTRPVFGKIRYMNENGCRRKFDVDAYIRQIEGLRKTID